MIEELFEVATEFKFDVGQALINTHALQGAVDDLSKASTGALTSINYLASGLVAHLGFGSGGLLTVLSKAVELSESFNESALGFANNISSNFSLLSGDIKTFNDRLATSKMLMGNVQSEAVKYGLNSDSLASITQLIASPLAARKKLGTNYEGGINMARNMMLTSETVGLPAHMGAEALARALSPGQGVGGKLFERLINTNAFRNAHVMHPQQLANMNQDKKIDLLAKAMEQLGGDADFLSQRMMSLKTQFQILKEQIQIVLRPIGDAIAKTLRIILQGVNTYIQTHGKAIGDNIGKLIGNIFQDPKGLLINLMQLKNIGADFKRAFHMTELLQIFLFLRWGLGLLGVTFSGGLLRRGLMFLIDAFSTLAIWVWNLGVIGKVFGLLKAALIDVLPAFMAFLFIFQVISRARAIARIADIENLLSLTPRITALIVRFKEAMERILEPIQMSINFWAQLIAPIFETSTWLNILLPVFEAFVWVLEALGSVILYVMSGISGLINVFIGFVDDISKMKNPFANMLTNLRNGYDNFFDSHNKGDPTKTTVNQVTNVGKIEARFDMREQLEPDRIAFAVTTHLRKLAINPTQGRGQSIGTAFAGNQGFAGAR